MTTTAGQPRSLSGPTSMDAVAIPDRCLQGVLRHYDLVPVADHGDICTVIFHRAVTHVSGSPGQPRRPRPGPSITRSRLCQVGLLGGGVMADGGLHRCDLRPCPLVGLLLFGGCHDESVGAGKDGGLVFGIQPVVALLDRARGDIRRIAAAGGSQMRRSSIPLFNATVVGGGPVTSK